MSRPFSRRERRRTAGVTLIELAIVIALAGILGALIVAFVAPVRSYIDTSQRAALADVADTALRRIGRDLRLALPNSVRVTTASGVVYLEFLLIRTGGRYRAESAGSASALPCGATPDEDVLSFGATDSCFKTIGGLPNLSSVTASDYLVVFNLQPGTPNADAYEFPGTGGNKSQISAVTAGSGAEVGFDRIQFAGNSFTYESPGNRFFIIEGPVTYACDVAAKTLKRYSGYGIQSSQPTPPGVAGVLMADHVAGCEFNYDPAVSQGVGLVTLRLQLSTTVSRGGSDTVSLYHAVHVSNVP